jgi:PAS domain S-box-containing protein
LLAAMVRSAEDAVVAQRLDGTIVSWNGAAERLYGYAAAEAVGQNARLIVPPELIPQQAEEGARLSRGEHIHHYETRRLRKDGSLVDVSVAISPIQTEAGELMGTSTIARDVSERRATETKFADLLETAPDAILAVDSEGRIEIVNRQAEVLFGYEREELLGYGIEILVPESSREIHHHHRANYLADPTTRPIGSGLKLAARRKDGTEFPCDISLSFLDTGQGMLVAAAVRDLTERQEEQRRWGRIEAEREKAILAAQILQSQRLESLGQLAGGVAHDFNNLLAVILNYAKFVADEVEGNEALKSDVAQIRKAAERATDLTHQLLIFGRREVVQPRNLDLNAVISDLEAMLRMTLAEHVELQIRLSPDVVPIRADPSQLDQVLVNLTINARDAMPEGGLLQIQTRNAELDEEYARLHPDVVPGLFACLTVTDTGAGMTAEVRARALEPFFTTKPRGEGSGLGWPRFTASSPTPGVGSSSTRSPARVRSSGSTSRPPPMACRSSDRSVPSPARSLRAGPSWSPRTRMPSARWRGGSWCGPATGC